MAWARPQFKSKGQVDHSGNVLCNRTLARSEAELESAFQCVNNWRAIHSFPLQAVKMTLSNRAKKVDKGALIAQRLKRLTSINVKLMRFEHMTLTTMQDVAGCRAVVKNAAAVYELVEKYKEGRAKNPRTRHKFVREKDYIAQPKADGYRSYHLVYRYRSSYSYRSIYNGLMVEIQLRSQLQHAWATAVETVGTITGQALKSNIGTADWLRFFALMGSFIAMREKMPLVPGTPTKRADLIDEIKGMERRLKVTATLEGWSDAIHEFQAAPAISRSKPYAYLLELDIDKKEIRSRAYADANMKDAMDAYLESEKGVPGRPNLQTVLVAVESIRALRSAYPNFYLDSGAFVSLVKEATK